MGVDELKLGIERFLDSPAARRGNIDREQARQLTKMYVGNIEKLINEADELFIGLGIDEAARHTVLDIGLSAKDGTTLARSMALQMNSKTNFAGFAIPEAAATLNLASKASPEDIEQTKPALQAARAQWAKQIDDSPDIPADKREAIKAVLGPLFDVIEKTVATGRIDAGAALVLLPKSVSFAFGGAVADGPAVENVLKQLVDLAKDIPSFPKLELNTGTIGDVKVHRLSAPIPGRAAEAREVFGDNLEILFGIGPKSIIVAGGKDAPGMLRKVIERSAVEKEKSVPPGSLNISLLPILKFSQSISDNPLVNSLIKSVEQSGNDRMIIVSQPGQRSTTTRIELQEGVIRAIGDGAKGAAARFNR